jgi:glycosyltransferase involved in cell wall biosynthesis
VSKLRILVDCSELNPNNSGGVRSYTLNIVKALATNPQTRVLILINERSKDLFQEIISTLPSESVYTIKKPHFTLKVILGVLEALSLRHIYIHLKSLQVRKILRDTTFDLVYTPTTYLNYDYGKTISIVTIHDIQEKDFPTNFSRRIRRYRDFRIRITLERTSSIHVSSSFIKSTVLRHYPDLYSEDLICVIPEGVEIARFQEDGREKKRQIIFPARSWPHKNHATLFKAIENSDTEGIPKIIITGATKEDFKKFLPISSKGLEFKGIVSESELTELYKESFAVISCSLYESSSLPILEGIAAGCIAIASAIPAHIEMAQHLDIELFEPTDSGELINLIRILTGSFGANLNSPRRNTKRISHFDWVNVGNGLVDEFLKRLEEKPIES